MNKREFLKLSGLAAAALFTPSLADAWAGENHFQNHFPYIQKPLSYDFAALEPYIDKMTMEIHFGKHHAAYIANLNKALENNVEWQKMSLIDLQGVMDAKTPAALRNNGGGHFNHEFFWEILSPKTNLTPSENLLAALKTHFGSFEEFKSQFSKAAATRFGSGWAWLCVDSDKKLFITSTPNQDNPLMKNIAEKPGKPLLALDVWEHAYYLKYQNRRADYTEAFFKIINWDLVSQKFES
jgi:Fe-Mn family superoxide dismutase